MSWRTTAASATPMSAEQRAFVLESTYGATPIAHTSRHVQWIAANPPTEAQRSAAKALALDLNAIPSTWRWQDVGLLASDMDSTLITCECIDEIADFAGIKPQVADITERAMRGELDFPQALRARVALLAGLPESVLARVYEERVRLSDGAQALVEHAHGIGAQILLVSGGFTYFTDRLKARLRLTHTRANVLGIQGGVLTGEVLGEIVDGQAKAAALRAAKATLAPGKLTIAMGDGANDIAMLREADLSVAFRAKPKVQAVAKVCLNHVGLDGVRTLFPSP